MDRFENDLSAGAPDVNACIGGEDVWIELKAPIEPTRSTSLLMCKAGNHPLLPSQITWFARQRNAGGIAFILVRTDKRMMLLDGTRHADAFNGMTADAMMVHALITCEVPTPLSEWGLLRHVILSASRDYRRRRQGR